MALTNKQIDDHPLLTDEQREVCKMARDGRRELTMFEFAQGVHRAAADDYETGDDPGALERASCLHMYEALRSKLPEGDTTSLLRHLERLYQEL